MEKLEQKLIGVKKEYKTKRNKKKDIKKSNINNNNNYVDDFEVIDLTKLEDVPIASELTKTYLRTSAGENHTKTQCPICLEKFIKGEDVAILQCWCVYHQKCFDKSRKFNSKIFCDVHRDLSFL